MANNLEALVLKSTGSWYSLLDRNSGKIYQARLRGKLKLSESKLTNPVAVGDWVYYTLEEGDTSQALIEEVLPRKNYIIRKSVHKNQHAQVIAANLDHAFVVASLFFPKTSLGFIDRFLVTAESYGIPVTVVFNKTDMWEAEEFAYVAELRKVYEALGYGVLETSTVSGQNLDQLKALIQGKISLLSGHSGVGKSSLINALFPDFKLETGEVSTFANKGKHTTTFAQMFSLGEDQKTFIIDTPGIKELGMLDMNTRELSFHFPEMRALLNQCRFPDCRHINEPNCVVRQAVEENKIALFRYKSYLGMMEEDDNRR